MDTISTGGLCYHSVVLSLIRLVWRKRPPGWRQIRIDPPGRDRGRAASRAVISQRARAGPMRVRTAVAPRSIQLRMPSPFAVRCPSPRGATAVSANRVGQRHGLYRSVRHCSTGSMPRWYVCNPMGKEQSITHVGAVSVAVAIRQYSPPVASAKECGSLRRFDGVCWAPTQPYPAETERRFGPCNATTASNRPASPRILRNLLA